MKVSGRLERRCDSAQWFVSVVGGQGAWKVERGYLYSLSLSLSLTHTHTHTRTRRP